jgi:hypothetical protein
MYSQQEADQQRLIDGLLLRLASKDAEFDKERQAWKQKERQYLRTIKDLRQCSAITRSKP